MSARDFSVLDAIHGLQDLGFIIVSPAEQRAGYRILAPGALDVETLERAAEVAESHIAEPGLSDNPAYVRFSPADAMSKKIAAAIRSLKLEGGGAAARVREEAAAETLIDTVSEEVWNHDASQDNCNVIDKDGLTNAGESVAWRNETDAEHIARDMREGRFPARSERQQVPVSHPAPQPSGPVCEECQQELALDVHVPDPLWAKISPRPVEGYKGGGLLCPQCIVTRLCALTAEPQPSVKVKPLDEDDYEEIISAAAVNMRKATSGIRGQVVTVQDSLDWWVMKETERRILSALTEGRDD